MSDCYKPYDDKFVRRDAQDAYEGAKWAWGVQQEKIDAVLKFIDSDELGHDARLGDFYRDIEELLK